jgi:isopenicillin N synthase-like dioxygenase
MDMFRTFRLPDDVTGATADLMLGKAMIDTWRADGVFQVQLDAEQEKIVERALHESKRFFRKPSAEKQSCVNDLSYSGYAACLDEPAVENAEGPEVFTICRDLPLDDRRVKERWPCHGPVPWPDEAYRQSMLAFMHDVGGKTGEKLLKLLALGLGLHIHALTRLALDGWHHMQAIRFPVATFASPRGTYARTEGGLLVIAVQHQAEGMDIRPPVNEYGEREKRAKPWLPGQGPAEAYDRDWLWLRLPLISGTATVFPGDMLQYLTGDYLAATPHKVTFHRDMERFSFAYVHEPGFNRSVQPLLGKNKPASLFCGKYFTDTCMRRYPRHSTTRRIEAEGIYWQLESIRSEGMEVSHMPNMAGSR